LHEFYKKKIKKLYRSLCDGFKKTRVKRWTRWMVMVEVADLTKGSQWVLHRIQSRCV
jgi:hypothetical protein